MKARLGDRVRMTGIMPEDPAPLAIGDEGVVTEVFPGHGYHPDQYAVEWEGGRSLLLLDCDPFTVIR